MIASAGAGQPQLIAVASVFIAFTVGLKLNAPTGRYHLCGEFIINRQAKRHIRKFAFCNGTDGDLVDTDAEALCKIFFASSTAESFVKLIKPFYLISANDAPIFRRIMAAFSMSGDV